jgi:PAS domain S-box-containing protein
MADLTRWLRFLSEANRVLNASLDDQATLSAVARLAVPELADWCDILMRVPDGTYRRRVVYHRDPAKLALVEAYTQRYPAVRPRDSERWSSLLEGRPLLISTVDEAFLRQVATDEEELAHIRSLGLSSMLLTPLVSRGELLGILTLTAAESGRTFGAEEIDLAADLGLRAATAVENARLYQAEREARAVSEAALQQLRAILDHSPVVITVADMQGKIVLVNGEYERRTGLRSDQLVGLTLYDLMPREQAASAMADDQRVIREKRAMQFESRIPVGDSAQWWFALKFPIHDAQGQVVGVGAIATDVTEQRRAQEALRDSEERFAKVFHAATLSIGITRADNGQFLDVNAAMETLTGYRADEIIGRTSVELGLWARPEERDRALGRLRAGEPVRNLEATIRDRQGRLREVLMTLELVEWAGHSCIMALGHDVTDMQRLREKLEQTQRMVALGRLAGGVAHDFNNILTAISGYSEVALDAATRGQSLADSVGHIQRAARRAADLTEQLLVFGRQKVTPPTVVELNRTVMSLIAMLQRLIGEDVHLEVALQPEVGAVEVVPAQLEQVILNLALNARDALPSGGRLRIETATTAGADGSTWVRLAVEDNGVGMDEATRARIFEPFFTTKQVGKGTGLGLATVYSIVEQAGGLQKPFSREQLLTLVHAALRR